jgi:predicted dehydrogenase
LYAAGIPQGDIGKICAAGAGLILCEKPLAPSYIEALSIARLCRKSKTRLVVNYPRQFDPVHRKAVELVKSGRLGKIRVVSGYYTKGLFNNGSHFINLLRAFFGNISGVKNLGGVFAKDAPYESPDFMTTHRGVKCLMRALDHRDYMLFELDIVGQKGRIRLIEKGNKIELYATDNDPIYKGYRALRLKKVFSGTFDKMMLSVIYAAAKGCFRKDDRWDIMAKEAAEDISLIEKILKEQSG